MRNRLYRVGKYGLFPFRDIRKTRCVSSSRKWESARRRDTLGRSERLFHDRYLYGILVEASLRIPEIVTRLLACAAKPISFSSLTWLFTLYAPLEERSSCTYYKASRGIIRKRHLRYWIVISSDIESLTQTLISECTTFAASRATVRQGNGTS